MQHLLGGSHGDFGIWGWTGEGNRSISVFDLLGGKGQVISFVWTKTQQPMGPKLPRKAVMHALVERSHERIGSCVDGENIAEDLHQNKENKRARAVGMQTTPGTRRQERSTGGEWYGEPRQS